MGIGISLQSLGFFFLLVAGLLDALIHDTYQLRNLHLLKLAQEVLGH